MCDFYFSLLDYCGHSLSRNARLSWIATLPLRSRPRSLKTSCVQERKAGTCQQVVKKSTLANKSKLSTVLSWSLEFGRTRGHASNTYHYSLNVWQFAQVVIWSFSETINYFILPTSFNGPGLFRMRCLHGLMALQVPWKPVSNTCSDDTWPLGKQLRALLAIKRLIATFFRHGHLANSIITSSAT